MLYEHTVVLPNSDANVDTMHGSVLFIGTATVLLRYAGFTILTDPNFIHRGDHVNLGFGQKAERLMDPAMELKDLPPLDMVVLSHLHEDHFDRYVANNLPKSTPIVTNPQAARELKQKRFYKVYALPAWDSLTLVKNSQQLRITAMPGKHGPGIVNRALPVVMGSMLEFSSQAREKPFRLYISGDTLIFKDLREIPKRYPDIDLGLFHLGGTKLFGVMLTMDAKKGIEAVKLIKPETAIPIHYNDYNVFKSPLSDFRVAVEKAKLKSKVHYLRHGETYNFEIALNKG